ncbi:uncharacterized protein LOC132056010 [Lycium ferocissimum]|uniref:uncharacterized protein LOC132056010 n=1 Tax=Lycium ferocissimum TaxID=112874 RepID=UPI002815714F|nr:uncharacterized protein LOC132056010 [Lycium ferocissimum]
MFAAQELNVLDLRELKLELPHDGIKFSSLRKLKLSRMFLDEHFIRALCASCICLEELTLHQCRGLASFQITGPKLRSVWLNQFFHEIKTLDTVAPNLENLHIAGNSRDLLEAIKISACKALKSLHLNCVGVTDEQDIFSSLSNLETLHLFHCNALKTMKMSSDRLECLVVRWCRNLIDVELDTPNLTIFSYTTHYDPQLPTLKLKASMLLKVQLGLYPAQSTWFDSHWYSKLLKFLGNFNQSKAIDLSCDSEKVIVIPKDMRKNLVPPLYGTDSLHIEFVCVKNQNYSVVDVLDSLLWIFPQLSTLSFSRCTKLSTLKFIYHGDAIDEDYEKICCASLLLKRRWRHNKLKEVQMENFEGAEKRKLRNYLSLMIISRILQQRRQRIRASSPKNTQHTHMAVLLRNPNNIRYIRDDLTFPNNCSL